MRRSRPPRSPSPPCSHCGQRCDMELDHCEALTHLAEQRARFNGPPFKPDSPCFYRDPRNRPDQE